MESGQIETMNQLKFSDWRVRRQEGEDAARGLPMKYLAITVLASLLTTLLLPRSARFKVHERRLVMRR
jgi:hypothetical protein